MEVGADVQDVMGVSDGIVMALIGYGLMIVVSIAAAALIRGIVLSLQGMQKAQKARIAAAQPPASVQISVEPDTSEVDEKARHVAAIAAAIYAVVGAHRLVYIGEARPSSGWTTTGRAMHQTSHTPKRSSQR